MANKKLSLSEAQLAASGMLPQQQDIMGDSPKHQRQAKLAAKKTVERQLEHEEIQSWVESALTAAEMQERADHANAGYPVMVKEEVDDTAANHEPGQALPEDAAERAANGSGYQGEEITDAEWEAMQQARQSEPAKQPEIVRKDANGQEVKVTEKEPTSKQQVARIEAQAQVRRDNAKAEKKTAQKAQPKEKQEPKPKVAKQQRETGVSRVNAKAVLKIFELAQAGKSNAQISTACAIPKSYIPYILSGHDNWIKVTSEQFKALGLSYPEPYVRAKAEQPAAKVEAKKEQPAAKKEGK